MFKKVLITGGAGFIGLHLARALAPLVDHLVLCDHFGRGRHDDDLQSVLDRYRNVSLLAGDLTASDTFDRLGEGYDTVFHLAGVVGVQIVEQDPVHVVKNNVISTIRLLDWMKNGGGSRLLFSSTSEVYADGVALGFTAVPTPETAAAVIADVFNPRASYALSKLTGEHLVAQYGRMFGLPFTIIRYHNVYGPRMGMEHVIPQMIERFLSGEAPLRVRSAGHTRAFCYVDDAVTATIEIAGRESARGRIIHVGNDGEETTILELARTICEVAADARRLVEVPDQAGSVPRRCPDIGALRALTGFTPSVTLREGLSRTYKWYHQRLAAPATQEVR